MDLAEAKREYLNILPALAQANEGLKALRKVERRCKKTFRAHCKQTNQPLTVGPTTFEVKRQEKVIVNMERIEEHFPSGDVERFKINNTEDVEKFVSSK